MSHSLKNLFARISFIKIFFLLLSLVVLGLNITKLSKKIVQTHHLRQKKPPVFLGIQFAGLDNILKDTEYIGYYTDKSLDDHVPAMQFAQAQYTLAPIVLDFNNINHPFVLIDCSSEKVAFETVKKYRLIPVRRNQFGIVLAKNPWAK